MRTLLILLVSLAMLSASAQSKKSDAPQLPRQLSLNRVNSQAKVDVQEMTVRSPRTHFAASAMGKGPLEPFYRRPAGAFYCSTIAINGVGGYSYNRDFVLMKPFAPYTFYTTVNGADAQTFYSWDVYDGDDLLTIDEVENLTFTYDLSVQPMPVFYVVDGEPSDPAAQWYSYQMPYVRNYPVGEGPVGQDDYTMAFAIPDPSVFGGEEGVEYLLSSKTTCRGGRYHNLNYTWICNPTGFTVPEDRWWWLGKNDQHVDAMAQAFEKPEHPYLLKKVYMEMAAYNLNCLAPVKLNCKIYRLDEIPAYNDTESVVLPDEPGTLIAFGEGVVTPTTSDEKYGFVEFVLNDSEDDDPELVYEVTPTIDFPILVVIDGYNDPEAADLVNFSSYISADYLVDEGYGETAYLKCPINDDEGNFTGRYEWRGLNNMFRWGTMKTAFSIFIVAEQPFVTFNWLQEDGEYHFPVEGGELPNGIEFYSWTPSVDEGWELSWNGSDKVPDWLHIVLTDGEIDGEFNHIVTAHVTADPIPQNLGDRQAVIRFEIPGAYIDYKFTQGGGGVIPPVPCPGRDGSIDISDINYLIFLILNNMYDDCYDVTFDGELNIADINFLVDYIIDHH